MWTLFILHNTIPYGQASSAHLQAHNHLDPHQEDEELICKHGHQDRLQIDNNQDQSSNNKCNLSNIHT